MQRTIEQWRGCDPQAMATNQSAEARMFAHRDARADILELDGERGGLLGLLIDCAAVLRTIDPDDSDEAEKLADLLGAIDRAQAPSRHQGALL